MYFKMNIRTRKSDKHACQFIVKGASMLEAVDYATEYLVAPELYIDNCYKCEESEIKEYDLVFPTDENPNINLRAEEVKHG